MLDAMATLDLAKTGGDYGKIRACGSAAFIVLSLILQNIQWMRPNTSVHIAFWAIVTSVAAFAPILCLPRKYTVTAAPAGNRASVPKVHTGSGFWTPTLVVGILIIIFCRFGMSPYYSFLGIFVTEKLHWDAVGLLFAIAATAEIPFMFISRFFIKRLGALTVLTISAAAIGVRMWLYGAFPTKTAIICAQLLHSVSFGAFHTAAVSFIAENVPPEKRAFGMSLYLALGSGLPAFLGAIIGGFVVQSFGYRVLFLSFISFPVLAILLYFGYTAIRRAYPGIRRERNLLK
jgi:PPP family 3-phenylpropionic acid transporter